MHQQLEHLPLTPSILYHAFLVKHVFYSLIPAPPDTCPHAVKETEHEAVLHTVDHSLLLPPFSRQLPETVQPALQEALDLHNHQTAAP